MIVDAKFWASGCDKRSLAAVGLQTAGYAKCVGAKLRLAVSFFEDHYEEHVLNDPSDEPAFVSMVNAWWYLKNRGAL